MQQKKPAWSPFIPFFGPHKASLPCRAQEQGDGATRLEATRPDHAARPPRWVVVVVVVVFVLDGRGEQIFDSADNEIQKTRPVQSAPTTAVCGTSAHIWIWGRLLMLLVTHRRLFSSTDHEEKTCSKCPARRPPSASCRIASQDGLVYHHRDWINGENKGDLVHGGEIFGVVATRVPANTAVRSTIGGSEQSPESSRLLFSIDHDLRSLYRLESDFHAMHEYVCIVRFQTRTVLVQRLRPASLTRLFVRPVWIYIFLVAKQDAPPRGAMRSNGAKRQLGQPAVRALHWATSEKSTMMRTMPSRQTDGAATALPTVWR